jgi:hypothetical protein
MAAKVGEEAEVPPTGKTWPLMTTWKPSPTAETSGNPLPEALKCWTGRFGWAVRKLLICWSWYDGRPKKLLKPPEEKLMPTSAQQAAATKSPAWFDWGTVDRYQSESDIEDSSD